MARLSVFVSIAAAIAVAAVGLREGTYAAGGSDSSCYALMADAFAEGRLQPASDLVPQVPWPDAPKTFTPGGFVASEARPGASAPVCAPGFSLLLAPLAFAGGREAIFLFTPIAGALLVWLTFLAARRMAGPLAGAMASVLMAASPPLLYQVVQPMNDVTTAALWMSTFVGLIERRWGVAGICCGLALLVRPNLLPLAIVCALFVVVYRCVSTPIPNPQSLIPNPQSPIRNPRSPIPSPQSLITDPVVVFLAAILPFGLLVLWLNGALYGSPFRTGYGELGSLFQLSAAATNAPRYLSWLLETHTPFPLLALAAPMALPRDQHRNTWLALALIGATCAVYLFYTPFDEWSYLRFLLPVIALMLVLASAVFTSVVARALSRYGAGPAKAGHYVLVALVTAAVANVSVRAAADRQAFDLEFLEQRYRSAGLVVRDRLPASAVVLSEWDSGAVRFHGRKEALTWQGLDPAWLDRSLEWLDAQGRTPYILLETWEEPGFRARFANGSDVGKLDWPPRYEIDRLVRIYDPKDRARYDRGERVDTEYLWPLRD